MNRKDEHIALAKAFHKEITNDFDAVRLIHRCLPSYDVSDISLATTLFGHPFATPFYINAMTGGSEKATRINQELAQIARATDLMMATGSVTAALKDPSVADSYRIVRDEFPEGFLLANVGAGVTLTMAQQAVDLFSANALQIHLNAPQELVMPEGDRAFSHWLKNIETIVAHLDVPVLVKEVGFGMTRETIQQLLDVGVKTIDISGNGGTSFTQIENVRRKKREFAYLADYGQSTVISLLEANEIAMPFEIVASGGIRNAYDIFKSLCLGAQAVGISGTILNQLLTNGPDATIEMIQQWQMELKILYTLVGCQTTSELKRVPLFLTGEPKDWCEARQISLAKYSLRTF